MLKQHTLRLRLGTLFDLGLDFFDQRHRFRVLDLKGGVHVRALRQILPLRLAIGRHTQKPPRLPSTALAIALRLPRGLLRGRCPNVARAC